MQQFNARWDKKQQEALDKGKQKITRMEKAHKKQLEENRQ
jgi:hypothetical protein